MHTRAETQPPAAVSELCKISINKFADFVAVGWELAKVNWELPIKRRCGVVVGGGEGGACSSFYSCIQIEASIQRHSFPPL